jgi:hypothetical protein
MGIESYVAAGMAAGVTAEISKLLFDRYIKSPVEKRLEHIEKILLPRGEKNNGND